MRYSTLFSTALVAAATASAQATYRVIAEPVSNLNTNFYQLSWVNKGPASLFVGDIKTNQAAEPYIVTVSDDGYVSFLSYHVERYQILYLNKANTAPVEVSTWQGIDPANTQKGFKIDDAGYLSLDGDNSKWSLCPTETGGRTYQLYYAGGAAAPEGCVATKLKTQAFGLCN